jgi:hypothetical protein
MWLPNLLGNSVRQIRQLQQYLVMRGLKNVENAPKNKTKQPQSLIGR